MAYTTHYISSTYEKEKLSRFYGDWLYDDGIQPSF